MNKQILALFVLLVAVSMVSANTFTLRGLYLRGKQKAANFVDKDHNIHIPGLSKIKHNILDTPIPKPSMPNIDLLITKFLTRIPMPQARIDF